MIECYSNSISVNTGEAITFNNVALRKGCTVDVSGASIQFNKPGIYEVTVHGSAVAPSASSSAAADVAIQLRKEGNVQPQAYNKATANAATDVQSVGFTSLVKVDRQGCGTCNCCESPVTCSVVNTGAPASFENVAVVVTKIV